VAERELSSRSSDHVRYLRSLHKRAGRNDHARLLVEGPAALTLLLADPRPVEVFDVLLEHGRHPDLERLVHEHNDNISWITEEVSRSLSETENPQGAFAEIALPHFDVAEIMAGPGPVIICDGIGDPGNAGTIMRTSHAVGASGVIFLAGCVDPFNGKAVRSAAGSALCIPISSGCSWLEVLEAAHSSGRPLWALSAHGDTDVITAAASRVPGDMALGWIVGSEAHGISPDVESAADLRVSIPMPGGAESLNAAMALGISLYLELAARR
jgi:RNA methyltransferase, TrmH family